MKAVGTSKRALKVFVASPGDVAEERQKARDILLALNRHPHYGKSFVLEPYLWDDPDAPTPMSFKVTPEDSVVHYGERPTHCDLLIGILRHRLGSPLPQDRYGLNPHDEPFTGTEWEIHDAIAHPGTHTDEVFVFASKQAFSLSKGVSAADRRARISQYDKVERFLEDLRGEDGSYRHGIMEYDGLDDFTTRLRVAVEQWLEKLLENMATPRTGGKDQKATPTPPGLHPPASAEPPILTFRLKAEVGEVHARQVTPCASAAPAVLTDEAEMRERIAAKDFEVLFEALFDQDSLHGFRNLARNCLGAAAPDRPEDTALRLRVVAQDWTLAGLPWQCIAHRGQPLGKAHWVIESIASGEAENLSVLEIPIENPLVLAPSDPTLGIGAARHASEVQDALRALLGGRGEAVTWARTRQELEFHLQQDPPDLIYCFTCLDGESALTLGRSESDRHGLRLEDLARLLQRGETKPLLWMNLIAPRALRLSWQTLLPHCRLLLVRQASLIDSEGASAGTLAWLDRLQEGERTLSALASAEPDPRVTLVHSGAPVRLRLPGAEDLTGATLRARIRAALLRILLGREPEKNLIYGYVKGAHDGDLLAYVAVGNVQACAHDFPAQVRHRLEQNLDDGLRIVTQFIPARIRAASAEMDIARLFKQHLLPTGGALEDALERLVRHPPQDGESVVIALPWLLDLAADVSLDEVSPWIEEWTRFHAETLIGAVPDRCRVLLGACIALEATDPPPPEQTVQTWAEQVLGMANDALDRAAGQVAVGFEPVKLEKPLGKLTADHLYRFYAGSTLGPRLLPATSTHAAWRNGWSPRRAVAFPIPSA